MTHTSPNILPRIWGFPHGRERGLAIPLKYTRESRLVIAV